MGDQSKSNILLSFGMWTSDATKSYIATVGHVIDSEWKLQTILLAFRRVIGCHSGENMAQTVSEVIKEYNIVNKLGYFVLDNAEANDTCVEAIINNLNPKPNISKPHRRLRCLGHIINLAAQAFLFGKDAEAFCRSNVCERASIRTTSSR